MAIELKTLEELKTMRRAGLLVGETLELLRHTIKAGMTTSALDAVAAARSRTAQQIARNVDPHASDGIPVRVDRSTASPGHPPGRKFDWK